jgi:predicted TIM-barrel enzyme
MCFTSALILLPIIKKIRKTINAKTIFGSNAMKPLIMLSTLLQAVEISAFMNFPHLILDFGFWLSLVNTFDGFSLI